MKIIVVNSTNNFRLIPDSALLLKNRPLFKPDYIEKLHAKIALIVKISRLGKYIQEKFAKRYYNEIGFALNFYDKNCLESLISKGLPWEQATCFDGSFALSEFVSIKDNAEGCITIKHTGNCVCDTSQQTFEIASIVQKIPATIAKISTCMTLKMGDYLVLEMDELTSAPLAIDDVVRLLFDGREVLKVVVK